MSGVPLWLCSLTHSLLHEQLFAECAHGSGHGSYILLRSDQLCKTLAEQVHQMGGLPGYASRVWLRACSTGTHHQQQNERTVNTRYNQIVL